MTRSRQRAAERSSAATPTVAVDIPADLARLAMVRSIAAAVGADADFDLDTIADLRMAVDELASILITHSAENGIITVEFEGDGDSITVTGSAPAATAAAVDQESFGWAVLTALVRNLATATDRDDTGRTILRIGFEVVADRGGT